MTSLTRGPPLISAIRRTALPGTLKSPRLGADWLFNRISGYRTLPRTQLELPIFPDRLNDLGILRNGIVI